MGTKHAVESVLLRLDLNQQREEASGDRVESKDVVGCREGTADLDPEPRREVQMGKHHVDRQTAAELAGVSGDRLVWGMPSVLRDIHHFIGPR